MVLTQHVAKNLKNAGVLKSHKLIVAVSGGMDSMLLWDTLRILEIDTVAVHINYNLRGEESNKDDEFVRAYADKHSLDLRIFQANPKDFESNLQENARIFRYEKFEAVKQETSASWVLTAHHFNDDVETFFLNLVRGAGLKGLKGISEKRDYFIRPFLDVPKKDLKVSATKIKLDWREDASNQTDKYLRNKIRHSVVPQFQGLDERAEKGLANSLQLLKKQNAVFEFFLSKYRKENITQSNGLAKLKLTDELTENPQLLFEVLAPYGQFQVEQIIASKKESGKTFSSEGYTIYLDRGHLLIEKTEKQQAVFMSLNVESENSDQDILEVSTLEKLPRDFVFSEQKAVLDFDKLTFPLTLRNWKQGDTFQPFGMKGRKKVSDYLINKKVPLPLKNKVLVLTSNNEIVWLAGLRIDDRFKMTSTTKKIYLANLLK